jgi:hypothetical protein
MATPTPARLAFRDNLTKTINKKTMTIQAINPGPKPKKEDGTDDRRHYVNPETKPKHPTLKPHKPKK